MSHETTVINFGHGLIGATYLDGELINPRGGWNLGTLKCWHRRYNLGDELEGFDREYDGPEFYRDLLRALSLHPSDFEVLYPEGHEWAGEVDEDATDDAIRCVVNKHYLILPVYLYDHSGLSMSTGSRSCRWDSGQVGYIYVSLAAALDSQSIKHDDLPDPALWEMTFPHRDKDGHVVSRTLRDKVTRYLEAEVRDYSSYLEGDIYGYRLFDTGDTFADLPLGKVTGSDLSYEDLEDFEEIDTLWGYTPEREAIVALTESAQDTLKLRAKPAPEVL